MKLGGPAPKQQLDTQAVESSGPKPYNPIVDVSEARELARSLLADNLPRRWDHVQGVASRAELFSHSRQADLIKSAAYLHDIGYAAAVFDTGFHPLDGARYLRRLGCDEAVVNLVANHSGAARIAHGIERGEQLQNEFPKVELLPHRELYFCDLTTSLDGKLVTADERLADVRFRHQNNPSMLQYLDANELEIRAMVAEIWSTLGYTPPRHPLGHQTVTH